MNPIITLKAGKEANVAFRHPWIFSGALEQAPGDDAHGTIVRVADKRGIVLATGTYSARSSIAVRVFAFGDEAIDGDWIAARIKEADERRTAMGYGPGTDTTGYRVVFGEADHLPGLVIDRYEDAVVFQISTMGMDRFREEIIKAIEKTFKPETIVERSDLGVRGEEFLEDVVAVHKGAADAPVEFKEHGLKYLADLKGGQKTGFFLDQKDARAALARLAEGRKVLNLFSYSGAAGVAMMKGGALSVHNMDSSEDALALCEKHAKLHKIKAADFTTESADIFQWLGEQKDGDLDMVVMDPPALIKAMKDAESGRKAYHFLNRAAMRLVRDGGIFATSSCSHFLTEDDLAYTLRRASVQAGITLDMLAVTRQSADHPQSVYFPESNYLKTFIFRVKR
ncbi:MAG TPA: class I SAM-dependent rRNA methyltransferase [Patescibacteria group bacterium]|nr:class I SAM-dependent rRNA methyltransferase [Patescibacteria group bacterium]